MIDLVRFTCPKCNKRCKVQSSYAGRVAVCKCGQRLRVPATQTHAPTDTDGDDDRDQDSDRWDESFDFLDDHSDYDPKETPVKKLQTPSPPKQPPNGWFVAWLVLTAVVIVSGLFQRHWAILYQAPIGTGLLIGLIALVYYSQPSCPNCQKRWAGTAWDHARQDGGPDGRFRDNYRRCCGCGHVRGHA